MTISAILKSLQGRSSSDQDLGEDFSDIRAHVLERIAETEVGKAPFYHLFIENILPEELFERIFEEMKTFKSPDKMIARNQDNPQFQNRRYPLASETSLAIRQFQALWEDPVIKKAFFSKFYLDPSSRLMKRIKIHEREFEFVFCEPGRFQNIHVDIPPKYMSFVFYFPSGELSEEEEQQNATQLYDRDLNPVYGARFRRNSVCVFVPHFYSYHGFSTSIDRDVVVLFYINEDEMKRWSEVNSKKLDTGPQFEATLDLIEEKLQRDPLIEYGKDEAKIAAERSACRINAPKGRVLID